MTIVTSSSTRRKCPKPNVFYITITKHMQSSFWPIFPYDTPKIRREDRSTKPELLGHPTTKQCYQISLDSGSPQNANDVINKICFPLSCFVNLLYLRRISQYARSRMRYF